MMAPTMIAARKMRNQLGLERKCKTRKNLEILYVLSEMRRGRKTGVSGWQQAVGNLRTRPEDESTCHKFRLGFGR